MHTFSQQPTFWATHQMSFLLGSILLAIAHYKSASYQAAFSQLLDQSHAYKKYAQDLAPDRHYPPTPSSDFFLSSPLAIGSRLLYR